MFWGRDRAGVPRGEPGFDRRDAVAAADEYAVAAHNAAVAQPRRPARDVPGRFDERPALGGGRQKRRRTEPVGGGVDETWDRREPGTQRTSPILYPGIQKRHFGRS